MADTIEIEEVGMGTQVQVNISMQPLTGVDENTKYDLSYFDWTAWFEGASKYAVKKSDAEAEMDADGKMTGTYLGLVDTSATGRGEIKAWLEVEGIPTIKGGTRKEVTKPVSINLKVV